MIERNNTSVYYNSKEKVFATFQGIKILSRIENQKSNYGLQNI